MSEIPSVPPQKAVQRVTGKRPRMSNFFRVLVTVTAIVQLPFAVACAHAFRSAGGAIPWIAFATAIVLGTWTFLGRAEALMPDKKGRSEFLRAVDIGYFVHWCASLFASIVMVLWLLVAPLGFLVAGSPSVLARTFDPRACVAAYVSGLAFGAYGVLWRRRRFFVREIDVPIRGLPKAFDGFTIAHLSDLHIGTLTPKSWGDRWAVATTARGADIAVVTGDMVTSGIDFHDDIAKIIGSIGTRLGVFVSMGNHDYFGDGEPLISMLESEGARVLRNEGVTLERDGARIYLAAIDDTWTRRDDLDAALSGRPEGAVTVLLAHDPERWPAAIQRNVELTLSGHTHGGQVAVPYLSEKFSLSHLSHDYNLGLYAKGDSTLYVHPGLGTTGPPIRLGVAPSVIVLTLRST
ncbi:MAG: metallophosphoesterase [Polyangiaceae bacterium]